MSNGKIISFEEGWKTLQKGITKAQNIAERLPEPKFTIEESMALYTTVYNMCTQKSPDNHILKLHYKYKETCEDYIKSKVLPSLQEKKNDLLLRELLRRWSTYMVMIGRLSKVFRYLDTNKLQKYIRPSLEETSFLSFNQLVYEEMNKEILDALFAVEEIEKCSPDILSKKINLICFDGVLEIDYGVTLLSKRFADITETISAGDVDTISVHKMSSKMLAMVLEYCKNKVNNSSGLTDLELGDWLAQFLDVDPKTLLDLLTSACYMKVDSLVKLTRSKVDGLIKGKTPEEIAEIFGAVDDSNSKLLEGNNE